MEYEVAPRPQDGTMRVLMVTNMYPTATKPSYGVFVKSQIDAIRRRGHDVSELFIDGSDYAALYATGAARVRWAIRRFMPEIVHAHFGLTGFIAAFPKNAPLVISLCGDDVLGTPSRGGGLTLKSRLIRKLTKTACRRADQLIVKSAEMKAIVNDWGFEAHVVPNGVDTGFFRPPRNWGDVLQARKRLGLEVDRKYVLFPNAANRVRKRVDLAREVIRRVSQAGIDATLLEIYGRSQQELQTYYLASDLMILTSEWEGSPNVIKEAMACNLPSVSFDVGDVRWLVEGTRFHRVVGRRDIDAMAKQVIDLLKHHPMERGDGRASIEAQLSGGVVAARVEEIYCRALRRPSRNHDVGE